MLIGFLSIRKYVHTSAAYSLETLPFTKSYTRCTFVELLLFSALSRSRAPNSQPRLSGMTPQYWPVRESQTSNEYRKHPLQTNPSNSDRSLLFFGVGILNTSLNTPYIHLKVVSFVDSGQQVNWRTSLLDAADWYPCTDFFKASKRGHNTWLAVCQYPDKSWVGVKIGTKSTGTALWLRL